EALAGEQQHQRAGRVLGAVQDERAELGLAGEQHLGRGLPGALGERDRPPGPTTSAQPSSARSGAPRWGSWGSASENVPSPVQWPKPMKISDPMPAASSPGSITSSSAAPPIPDTSISRNAPIIGEPSSVLIAAKLPADATTTFALSGASRLASRTAQTPSPPPRAISGASGPSTIPRHRPARAASTMPGSSLGDGAPPALNPSAGECPPVAGRYRIASATRTPEMASSGIGQHTGVAWNARPRGRVGENNP